MKDVVFLGEVWSVPDWAVTITQDLDKGSICVWEKPPAFGNAFWSHDTKDWLDPGECKCIGHRPVLAPVKKI